MLLPAAYLDTRIEDTGRPTVELGWASTVHSAQGRTVDQAIMVVDENTDAEALHVGMSRGRTSNVAEAGDDTEDLADLIRAAVQSPTASEVVLDAGPHPADTGRSRGPGGGRPGPGDRQAAAARGGTRTDHSRGPGQRGRPGRTAAGVGRPDAGGCRPIGGRSTRPNRRRGAAAQETAPAEHQRRTAECPSPGQDPPRAEPRPHQTAEGKAPAAGTDPRVGTADTRRPTHRRSATADRRNMGDQPRGRPGPGPATSSSRPHASNSPTRPRSDRTGQAPKSGSNHP